MGDSNIRLDIMISSGWARDLLDTVTEKTGVVTLDYITSFCKSYYSDKDKRIIVIVLARYDLDEVKSIINKHFNYWNELTGEELDFFWLGYDTSFTSDEFREADGYDIIEHIKFDNTSFIKDVNWLKRLTRTKIGDEISLMLLDFDNGEVKYEKNIYLRIEKLIHKKADTNLKRFFSYLITTCRGNTCIDEVRNGLKIVHKYLSADKPSNGDFLVALDLLKDVL